MYGVTRKVYFQSKKNSRFLTIAPIIYLRRRNNNEVTMETRADSIIEMVREGLTLSIEIASGQPGVIRDAHILSHSGFVRIVDSNKFTMSAKPEAVLTVEIIDV